MCARAYPRDRRRRTLICTSFEKKARAAVYKKTHANEQIYISACRTKKKEKERAHNVITKQTFTIHKKLMSLQRTEFLISRIHITRIMPFSRERTCRCCGSPSLSYICIYSTLSESKKPNEWQKGPLPVNRISPGCNRASLSLPCRNRPSPKSD